jgi:glycosyltransferase involved in cell wall biosynthesis
MRIAFLTTDNRQQFKQFDKPEPFFGTAPEALLQGFARLPDVEVHVVSCLRQPVKSPEKIAPNIYFHSVVVPKLGWMRTLYQGCIRATRKKLREIQPDIVHGQGTELDCAVSAVFSGLPNVLTIHGNMKAIAELYHARPGSFHWLAAKLETFALGRTTGVFCNSGYTEKQVAPRAKKTWNVPNALRQEFFTPLPQTPRPSMPVFLNVGHMTRRKQQCELIEVARRLHQRDLKFEFQFAGEKILHTDYGAEFARRLAPAEREGYARHLGVLPTQHLIAAMDAASALIHFPIEEAFGLVVAEALARNLKFFGAATGGVVDIARGIEGAELFPAQNFTALENALARWLDSGCPQPQNADQAMREQYHPEVIARRHLEIYREVLQR